MKKILTAVFFAIILWNLNTSAFAAPFSSDLSDVKYPRLNANLEYGFLSVIDHKIQFSRDNTYFDYRKYGGQNTLFAVGKYSLDVELDQSHKVVFLYQPLSLDTKSVLDQEIKQDNITFAKGTPMKFLYDFPFFRASYLYDFNTDPFEELSVGGSLQLRNATIEFESLDGKQMVSKKNVGPVPIIKFRSKNRLFDNWWYGTEIDGFYAPISYLNGSNNEVIGAILDSNLKLGVNITEQYSPYINLRYIAGGSVGQSSETYNLSDGYSNNWLHFFVISLGFSARL